MNRKKVGIILFKDVEVLDYCGPFEVFSVTRLDPTLRQQEPSPFEVLLIAETLEVVTTTGGMQVLPQMTFAQCPALDILVVPGGYGTRAEMHNETMLSFIQAQTPHLETLTSVCTGSLVLAKAGLLNNRRATTHWQALDLMQRLFPAVLVDRTSHVVEDGSILTSAGISAGIDLALRVVSRYFGEAVARTTAQYMEYPFPESNARRIAI